MAGMGMRRTDMDMMERMMDISSEKRLLLLRVH